MFKGKHTIACINFVTARHDYICEAFKDSTYGLILRKDEFEEGHRSTCAVKIPGDGSVSRTDLRRIMEKVESFLKHLGEMKKLGIAFSKDKFEGLKFYNEPENVWEGSVVKGPIIMSLESRPSTLKGTKKDEENL